MRNILAALLLLSLQGIGLADAGFSQSVRKTYHFKTSLPDDRWQADRCCSSWMDFTDLDPAGIDLGDVVLGVRDNAFFHYAKKGESFTRLETTISAKKGGIVDIYYVFTCDQVKNPECPLGHVTVPFVLDIECGDTPNAEYVSEYSWLDLGVKLARMITSRPDPSAILTGKAVVVHRDVTSCESP